MAALVNWLKYSGARKVDGTSVASGNAYFYVPGTTNTLASIFSDKDGLVGRSNPVALDASGRAEVYLKAAAHVEIYDAAGVLVAFSDRANTVSAAQVEIENLVATGTDLVTGQQVAGGRTDLDTWLTSMLSSFGTTDAKVLFNGVPTNLKDIISTNANVFYNVKASPYNAIGDGSTDDTLAIQAAFTAAGLANGGIVYFPAGTYKVTSATLISTNAITLLGTGGNGSIIKNFGTGTAAITISGNNTEIHGLGFTSNATTGFVATLTGADPKFYGCIFTTGTGGSMFSTPSACAPVFYGCTFNISNASTGLTTSASATSVIKLIGCFISIQLINPSTLHQANGSVLWIGVQVTNNGASGTTNVVANTITRFLLTGCILDDCAGTAVVNLQASGGTLCPVIESACYLGAGYSYSGGSLLATQMSQRNNSGLRTVTAAAAYIPDATKYRVHEVESSGAAMAFSTPTGTGLNVMADLEIRFKNTNAGAVTPTFSAAYKIGALPAVPQNNALALFFRWSQATSVWIQVANTGAIASYAA